MTKRGKTKIVIALMLSSFIAFSPTYGGVHAAEDSSESVFVVDESTETGSITVGPDAANVYTDDEKTWKSLNGANVYADSEDTSITVNGDISASSDESINGGVAGLEVASMGANATANVSGDVKVNNSSDSTWANAVSVNAYGENEADVNVSGDVSLTGTGNALNVYSDESGEATITVGGDVESDENGIISDAFDNSNQTIDIKGGVNVTGDDAYFGLSVYNNENATSNIKVGDGLTVSGKGSTYGMMVSLLGKNSKTNISVTGDLNSSGTGILIDDFYHVYVDDEGNEDVSDFRFQGTADITVNGTIVAKESAIVRDNGNGDGVVNLTVWKIVPNEKGEVANKYNDEGDIESDTDFESKIKYIIRVEQGEGYSIGASKADGNALDNSGEFGIAYEGDKIRVNIDVQDGYTLKAVYNGLTGEKMEIVKDADGNYYVVVPKGGGVILSAEVEKASTVSKTVNATNNLASPKTGDAFNNTLAIIMMIMSFVGMISVIDIKRRRAE